MNNSNLSFSLAAIAILQNHQVIATSRIPGSFSAEIAPDMTLTRTGASTYPAGARASVSDGEMTIQLNERPLWTEGILGEGQTSENPGSPAHSFVQLVGNSIVASDWLIVPRMGQTIAPGRYEIIATAADAARVIAVTTAGVFDESVPAAGGVAAIGQTGAQINTPEGGLTVGDRAYFEFSADTGQAESLIDVPQVRRLAEYGLLVWSADGADAASVVEYHFPRVVLSNARLTMEADAANADVVIEGRMLAPLDGGAVVRRRVIHSQ